MPDYTPEVKKGLISLLMFSIYSEQRTIYREYVQNALDSINKAVEGHILNAHKDGRVEININSSKKIVTIRDNGTGVNLENAVQTLLDISSSTKDGITQAGQFGIGRLVGGGYCHKLIFKTSARGESEGTKIVFDVDQIWQMVKLDETDYLATEVIKQCTSVETFDCEESEHFFEVILEGIKDDSAHALLDSNGVIDYLSEVAPVEYTPQFNNILIFSSLNSQPDYKELFNELEKVQIFVGSTRIQKRYGLKIKGTKDDIDHLEFFKIEDEEFGVLGWGWFALTKFSIIIPKDDKLACIRLRKHNIQIGASNQLSGRTYWKEERSNSYFYGEFFVTHPNITPNAARDGLAPTPETNALYRLLKDYFENLKSLYNKANDAKKCVDRIYEGIKRLSELKVYDHKVKDLIDNKGLAKFDKLIKNAAFGPTKRMLLLYQTEVDKAKAEAEKMIAKIKSVSSAPAKPASGFSSVQTPPNTITPSTAEPNDLSTPNVSSPTNAGDDGTSSLASGNNSVLPVTEPQVNNGQAPHPAILPSVSPIVSPSNPLKPTTTSLLGNQDIVNRLSSVLEPSEVFLVRRIFRVLNTYCPDEEHDKTLVKVLQEMIIKELLNGN